MMDGYENIQAEQGVIGGLMLDNSTWNQINGSLKVEDFSRREHQLIFRAIAILADKEMPFDVVTITDQLGSHLQAAGGLDYVKDLAMNTPSAANIKAYADTVTAASINRKRRQLHINAAESTATADLEAFETQLAEILGGNEGADKPFKHLLLNDTSCANLLNLEFEDMHWNIEKLLPAGSMLLFGKPKKGKSFLTLMISISVAAGREVFGQLTSGSRVLYLGLEDSKRRMQRRVRQCASALNLNPVVFQENMHVETVINDIDNGLIDELYQWMKKYPDTGLIVIDMLKKITGRMKGNDLYKEQARVGDALSRFCHNYPKLSIIVVHHSRKADSDDPFDLMSGTTGLSGSYDCLAAIKDDQDARTLHLTGRDIDGAEIQLLMNQGGMYTLEKPDPEQLIKDQMSRTRRRVYDAVSKSMPMERKNIIAGCGLDDSTVDQQLAKLKKAGLIVNKDYGKWQKTGKRYV